MVAEWKDGAVRRFTVTPEDAGLARAGIADLRGGDAEENAAALAAAAVDDGRAAQALAALVEATNTPIEDEPA